MHISKQCMFPIGLTNKADGSGLMLEGTDNIDINGKGTFHALARFMFQDQCVEDMPEKMVIPRGKDTSLKITDAILTLVECEP